MSDIAQQVKGMYEARIAAAEREQRYDAAWYAAYEDGDMDLCDRLAKQRGDAVEERQRAHAQYWTLRNELSDADLAEFIQWKAQR